MLLVALSRNNTLAVIDLATLTFTTEIPVSNAPCAIVTRVIARM
jgi:YVTN family beta-propeller protein